MRLEGGLIYGFTIMPMSPEEMAGLLQNARLNLGGVATGGTPLQAATILESVPGSRFDVFSFLAARTLGTPVAGISLLDGPHHWLRSAEGFNVSLRSRRDPFCVTLMAEPDQVLLVEDASRDQSLSSSQLVRSPPFIRSYAGVALRDAARNFLGTIFVGDTIPRVFAEADLSALRSLGLGLETVLALHDSVVRLCRAVTCDYLTGLLNRGPFELKVQDAVAKAAGGPSCAVICLDIDSFKEINDRLGHAVGDAVLVETARRLALALRRSDSVARLSGDEFAVLMMGPLGAEDVVALMRRILAAFGRPFEVCGTSLSVSVSLGAAMSPDDAGEAEQLMRRADIALYDAKHGGGDCFRFYDPVLEARLLRRKSLRRDLEAAIEGGGLHLAWQPIVASEGGALRGYEALVRWTRPFDGPTSPADFIPFAEETGLIVAIDTWVLNTACDRAATLPAHLRVAVNVWPGWFGLGRLGGVIQEAVDRSGLEPSRLEIEITERALITRSPAAVEELNAIRSSGVRLVLDDFGVGYSSLRYLSEFSFDVLKLDAAFVQNLCVSSRSRQIALHVLQLGHELGIEVCAEGVENERQRSILREDGYDWLQGFLIGRPTELPVEERHLLPSIPQARHFGQDL